MTRAFSVELSPALESTGKNTAGHSSPSLADVFQEIAFQGRFDIYLGISLYYCYKQDAYAKVMSSCNIQPNKFIQHRRPPYTADAHWPLMRSSVFTKSALYWSGDASKFTHSDLPYYFIGCTHRPMLAIPACSRLGHATRSPS